MIPCVTGACGKHCIRQRANPSHLASERQRADLVDSGFDFSCQFLLGCLRSIDLIGRPAAEDRVGPIGIVVADPPTDPCSCRTAGVEGIEVDALVLQ